MKLYMFGPLNDAILIIYCLKKGMDHLGRLAQPEAINYHLVRELPGLMETDGFLLRSSQSWHAGTAPQAYP